jgi:hypothetical protein
VVVRVEVREVDGQEDRDRKKSTPIQISELGATSISPPILKRVCTKSLIQKRRAYPKQNPNTKLIFGANIDPALGA